MKSFLITFLVLFPLVIEGLGIPNARKISYLLILILPLILFLNIYFKQKKVLLPKNFSISFLIFLLVASVSTIQAVNVQRSFEYLLYLISIFLIFIYVYNKKIEFEKIATPFIVAVSLLFSLYSFALSLELIQLPIPSDGYQFVYAKFNSHNHLGDFLILPITISIYFLYKKIEIRNYLRNIIVFTPFLIFSYSRSAYVALLGATIAIHIRLFRNLTFKKTRWFSRTLVSLIIALSLALIFIITKEYNQSTIYELLEKQGLSNSKEFLASRPEYLAQATKSLKDNPLLGIGSDNFIYASFKYTTNPLYGVTYSAHNIFGDILVGFGIINLIVFIHIIYLLLKFSKKGVLFFAFLAMLMNFQTDYTHTIYSFLALFFVIVAIIYTEKNIEVKVKYFLFPSIILFIFSLLIFASDFYFSKNKLETALKLYPLNQKTYEPLISKRIEGKKEYKNILKNYENLFSGDASVMEYLGNYYETKDRKKALFYYEKTLEYDLFNRPYLIKKVYEAKKEIEGINEANQFRDRVLTRVNEVKHIYFTSEYFNKELALVCKKYNWSCKHYQ